MSAPASRPSPALRATAPVAERRESRAERRALEARARALDASPASLAFDRFAASPASWLGAALLLAAPLVPLVVGDQFGPAVAEASGHAATVVLVAMAVSAAAGLLAGALALIAASCVALGGQAGRGVEALVSAVAGIPGFLLAMPLAAAFPPIDARLLGAVGVTAVIAATLWPRLALTLAERLRAIAVADYSLAARLAGAGGVGWFFRHAAPPLLRGAAAAFPALALAALLTETGLGFLGLTTPLDSPGVALRAGWTAPGPSAAAVGALLALALTGFGLIASAARSASAARDRAP